MKKLFCVLLAMALLISGGALSEETQPGGLTKDILVLFTSDVHCGVDQGFGYAGLQAVRDAAVDAGNHVLLVDDGDSIQGESIGVMTRGEADILLMNALNYDVAIPGNHEFDYGMDRFLELADMASFPYISCNFNREGELIFAPWIIKEFDGVKLGFVGVTTPETLVSSNPKHFQDETGRTVYGFMQGSGGEMLYAAVQKAVDEVRAAGASYVFVIAHLGNETSCKPYMYSDVIEHTTGIDALLDGHSHDVDKVVMKNRDGKTVIRQACGTKMQAIGWLRVSARDGSVDTGLYTWSNDVPAPELLGIDNELSRQVEEATADIRAQLSEVVGTAPFELTINDPTAMYEGLPVRIIRRAETNLGDFCADAARAIAGADIAIINGGSIRTSIHKGDVTINDVLNAFPFGDHFRMIEATGSQVLSALEFGVSAVPSESGAFPQVSGLTYEIHTYIDSSVTRDENGLFTGVKGERRVRNVMVGGEPLDVDKHYKVVGIGYEITDHGDGQTAFDGAEFLWESEKLDFLMLVDYLRDELQGVIGAEYADLYGQGRIVAVETAPET